MQQHVLSCDWGTSSFRLRLIDTSTRSCLAKVESDRGNASLFNEWKAQKVDRVPFYLQYVKQAIGELKVNSGLPVNNLPVLISGMASSSVGMKELPYADLPFSLDGSSAYAEWVDGAPVLENKILLISGAHQRDDVMRGEETQLVGLASLLDLNAGDNTLFILPGTHSKHIAISGNSISRFNTFMTGELFDIIARHSILSHAVHDAKQDEISEEERKSFYDGVKRSLGAELTGTLFSVRINQLKKYLSPEQNYFYLSGLLIGSEVKYLTNQKLILCSSSRLQRLYEWALDCVDLLNQTHVVSSEMLDNAATVGQLKIYAGMVNLNK
ncbi:MAG: 2-dehydro-3-deoxygalactonokinase [Chitinophagaceae bacterium]|nr:2-dehydro-3-deoxygalactonokinase [Chitinophagaceae bacterium]